MAACEKCGTVLPAGGLNGLCPRCLMAEGLGDEPPKSSDTSRFSNPFFLRAFGDYELIQEVARGGMGVIYKAHQRSLGRIVAIKVLSSGEFASPEYVRRFRAEAAAAARLQHPNIVAIHEVGQHEGIRYFSMDFVEGPNLSQLQAGRSLPPQRAAAYLKTLAETIQYAHQQGILHRDLKPSNVLIDPFGEPRITDFGLAKELSGDSDLTVPGQVLGTPGYLPPEQADTSHGPLTPAADVYSLGAILYYMLTARAPFVSGSLRETLRQMLASDPVAPSSLNPEIPRDLETICLKCLERSPGRRYPSAAALAEDLRRFLADESIVARPATSLDRFTRWCRRRPTLAAVWVLSFTLAIGSTFAAFSISRARGRAESSLARTLQAEAKSQEQLREARLAQARAVRRTSLPGRRSQALAALSEAATIRRGPDLREEALAALMLADVAPSNHWDLQSEVLLHVSHDPVGNFALTATGDSSGLEHDAPLLRRWSQTNVLAELMCGPTNRIIGPLRFNADSSVIMAHCRDATLRLWHTGETNAFVILPNRPLPGHDPYTEAQNDAYDFSPDGKFFAVGLPGPGVSLHSVADGAEIARRAEGVIGSILRFAPDGRHLAITRTVDYTNRVVEVLTVPGLALTNTFTLKEGPSSLAWSSDGRELGVSAEDNTITVFSVPEGRTLKTLACPNLGEGEFAFLGGNTLIGFRGVGSTLRLANPASGAEELVINGFSSSALAVTRDGSSFITMSLDNIATRWAILPPVGFQTIPIPRPVGYQFGLNQCCLDFSPDSRWVVSSHGRFILLRSTLDGHLVQELVEDQETAGMTSVAFCEGGRALLRCSTVTGLSRITLEYSADGQPHFGPATPLDPEPGFMISDHPPDGRRLALIDLNKHLVKILEITGGKSRQLSRWAEPECYSVALQPEGGSALVNCAVTRAYDPAIKLRLRRVEDGTVIRELPGIPSCDTAWSGDGRYVLTSNGQKRSTLWNTATWQPVATLDGPLGGESTTFALAPDGTYAVINRDDYVALVATKDGGEFARLPIPAASDLCAGIRFLPDGRRFAILWRDGRIDLLDPEKLRDALRPLHLEW